MAISQVTRLNGLSNSGFDVDAMVQKLMTAANIPMDKLNQKKQTIQWQRDDYRTMNAKLLDFRNTVFNMKLPSTYLSRKASTTDDSIVTATATSSANQGNYTIKIDKLAKAAAATTDKLTAGLGADTTALSAVGAGLSGTTTLSIGGDKGTATIELSPTDTIAGLVNAVNGQSSVTGVKVSYDKNMDRLFFTSSTTGSTSKITLNMKSTDEANPAGQNLLHDILMFPNSDPDPANPISTPHKDGGETINGSKTLLSTSIIDNTITTNQTFQIKAGSGSPVTFTIDSSTTVGKLIDNINNSDLGKTGISAYLDGTGKIAFINPDASNPLTFTDTSVSSKNELTKLGLDGTQSSTLNVDYSQYSAVGTNSVVEYNGITTGFATNTFSINGVSFSAKKEQAPGDAAVGLTITQDSDTMYNSIKAFVDKYNDLISTLNAKTAEKYDRTFPPLTDTQRAAMKDADITKWEDKAKVGLLHNDSIINSGVQNLRAAVSGSVSNISSGDFKSLADVGIASTLISGSFVTGDYSEKGKIYIDETKLRKALDENPEQVMNLFTAKGSGSTSDVGKGVATRLYDQVTSLMSNITSKAGTTSSLDQSFTLGKSVIQLNLDITTLTTKLDTLQTRYYNQFTAMESYINRMNAQSAQLANFGK